MSQDVVAVPAEMPALRAAQRMVEKGIRHLVVTDCFGKIVGMLSERDVVKHLSPWLSRLNPHISVDAPAPRCDVQEIMIQRPITVTPDTTLSSAASLLGKRKLGCLPVVDHHDRPVGLLSVVDMLLHMASSNAAAEPETGRRALGSPAT